MPDEYFQDSRKADMLCRSFESLQTQYIHENNILKAFIIFFELSDFDTKKS